MIDEIRIEADERGWLLILQGDLGDADGLSLRLSDEAAAQLVRQVEPIRDHLAEGEAVRREFEASGRVSWAEHRDSAEADPAEELRAGADHQRKAARENPC